ncbi:MAG: hypothetical protein K8R69_12390, partial [Deltaproteobacteria bacterium]|nr:hypothetical protein [Deltaproteobacteria bacterium]
MKNFSGKSGWWLPLVLALSACTGGSLDGSAGGGPVGASQANFAQGTLGSLPDIQQMSDGCFSLYTMRFSGEAVQENKSWFQISEGQKAFPTPGLILKNGKESLPNEEICTNCEGKIVRGFHPGFGIFVAINKFKTFGLGIDGFVDMARGKLRIRQAFECCGEILIGTTSRFAIGAFLRHATQCGGHPGFACP